MPSLPQTIQFLLPRPERRDDREIEDDLDDEFAFHLEQSTRDLIAQGHDPQAARGLALSHFGDLNTIKTRCKRIALEERIMLQRINFIMMAIVLVLVVALGVQMLMTQKANTAALRDITTQLTRMQQPSGEIANTDQSSNVVYIEGVARPGVYGLQGKTMTVRQLIDRAGGPQPPENVRVVVSGIENNKHVIRMTSNDFIHDTSVNYELKGQDQVLLSAPIVESSISRFTGVWRELNAQSEVRDTGAQLVILDPNDPRNIWHKSGGVLVLENEHAEIGLEFLDSATPNLRIWQMPAVSGRTSAPGQWTLEGKTLSLDLSSIRPALAAPLKFTRTGDVPDSAFESTSTNNRGFVYVDGNISRPGVYSLPAIGQLTLRRLWAATRLGSDYKPALVSVTRLDANGKSTEVFRQDNFGNDPNIDFILQSNDHVLVQTVP